jgi:hypothetical protein
VEIYRNLQTSLVGDIRHVGGSLKDLGILDENTVMKLSKTVDSADAKMTSAVETGLWPQ